MSYPSIPKYRIAHSPKTPGERIGWFEVRSSHGTNRALFLEAAPIQEQVPPTGGPGSVEGSKAHP